ncbi:MAG: T9SS type A sorting domain-containing protein [Bacteroidales bacterium]|nr:T9SS type A sorting domain-containing protein [Bacteroidales bacterium]
MYKILFFVASLLLSFSLFSQVETLERIGQTRMSASSVVEWDSLNSRIIVGAGAVIKIYNATNPNNIFLEAQRPLKGAISEFALYGDTLFVSACHDGVYAIDYMSPELDIIDWYNMHNEGVKGAYDMFLFDDTLYIADNIQVRILTYQNGSFTYQNTFGPLNSIAVARRGDLIAIGNRGLVGTISIYNAQNLSTALATWQNSKIWYLMDVDFADLNDSIIYVCGGPENLLNVSSVFYALHYDGSNLTMADSLLVAGGMLGFAQINIMNMSSKNDTLFLTTTAAINWPLSNYTIIPILDATGLPNDTMVDLGFINAGLWHFDAAVMHGTDYMAIASEWLGTMITDISQLNPLDTISFHTTGGWTNNCFAIGDTLYSSQEGDGMYVYSIDSLMFSESFMNNAILAHWENGGFISSALYLNDSLLLMNTGDIYNVKTWKQGGSAFIQDETGVDMVEMELLQTNTGPRIAGTATNFVKNFVNLYDPFDAIGSYAIIETDTNLNSYWALESSGDTLYYGKKYGVDFYLQAVKVANDQFQLIDTIKMDGEIHAIDIEGSKIAVGCQQSVSELGWNGNELQLNNSFFDYNFVVRDIDLKNGYYYIADKFYGAQVVDMSAGAVAAKYIGSEGWLNLFGSTSIFVRDDGVILLSDFHAGTFIIEKFDTTLIPQGIERPDDPEKGALVYPNPADQFITVLPDAGFHGSMVFSVFDLTGRLITRFKKSDCEPFNINTSSYEDGTYVYSLRAPDGKRYTGKFVVRH